MTSYELKTLNFQALFSSQKRFLYSPQLYISIEIHEASIWAWVCVHLAYGWWKQYHALSLCLYFLVIKKLFFSVVPQFLFLSPVYPLFWFTAMHQIWKNIYETREFFLIPYSMIFFILCTSLENCFPHIFSFIQHFFLVVVKFLLLAFMLWNIFKKVLKK